MTISAKDIGQRIKFALKQAGLNQRSLAKLLGITDASVSAYIQGDARMTEESYALLSEKSGVSIDWLITGKPPTEIQSTSQPVTVSEPETGYSPEIEELIKATNNNPLIKLILPGMLELSEDDQFQLYKMHKEMLRKSREKGGRKAAPDEG